MHDRILATPQLVTTSQIFDWIVKYKYVNGRATAAAETMFGPSIVVVVSDSPTTIDGKKFEIYRINMASVSK